MQNLTDKDKKDIRNAIKKVLMLAAKHKLCITCMCHGDYGEPFTYIDDVPSINYKNADYIRLTKTDLRKVGRA